MRYVLVLLRVLNKAPLINVEMKETGIGDVARMRRRMRGRGGLERPGRDTAHPAACAVRVSSCRDPGGPMKRHGHDKSARPGKGRSLVVDFEIVAGPLRGGL